MAQRLCGALDRIKTVLVGTYRDEEEQRFADFGGTLAHEIRGQLNEAVQLALHNLVENAVKYADPEKDERWVRIHVLEDPEQEHWLVQIGDNGIGIPEVEQERVFARFLRSSRAQGRGFGLGLSIARQTALSVGGTVMLESREGEGSTFSFTAPFGGWGAWGKERTRHPPVPQS